MIVIHIKVATKQNIINFGLAISLISTEEISLKSWIGNSTLKTKSLVAGTKSLVKMFFCLKIQPKKIIKNMGTVAFKLNIRFSNLKNAPLYILKDID